MKIGEITKKIRTTRHALESTYTFLEGSFNLEGTWQCEMTPECSGSLFMQVIFVRREEDLKGEFEIQGKL